MFFNYIKNTQSKLKATQSCVGSKIIPPEQEVALRGHFNTAQALIYSAMAGASLATLVAIRLVIKRGNAGFFQHELPIVLVGSLVGIGSRYIFIENMWSKTEKTVTKYTGFSKQFFVPPEKFAVMVQKQKNKKMQFLQDDQL